ncbi:DUF4038 domain-containing protein [Pelagicoccus sp. SDUM812002]|uniref:apiosidase-like domain-containing protein n=1 Tax=Pelagicoccus sp. SDUM812002 TaxID=3041266 RepID=UPI00280DBCB0|nr:DUF4038 domain-containing protein [Pelagicoccus sp. SDUM812002]MDQ8186245.1 DUF4038 domain-containing protein [Pelagicoccus sp. SDUM812002]
MKLAAILIPLLLSATIALPASELALTSYNIRLDLASDGPNRWDERKEQLAAQLAALSPDIIGIQEGMPHQVDYLAERLKGYTHIGVGRDDGKRQGEFSALYYRPADTELLATETFWLSETPQKPSYGWGANYRRICTYGHFRDRSSGSTYWVFNTHFDHEVPEARLNSARLILKRIEELVAPTESYFLMGDLNATPESPPIQLLSQHLLDSRVFSSTTPCGPEATFNDFDNQTLPQDRIDYIFTAPDVAVSSYATRSDLIEQRYPSDHFPVTIQATLFPYLPSQLAVSKSNRQLVDQNGAPFFWLADTAWELFHRLNLEDATHYLDVRAAQGFNLVQAVILAEQSGLTVPNANGDLPLHELDPTRPNEAYFRHVDAVVANANARGLVVGLLPTWGDKFNKKWGVGPEIFSPENAETYGRFLSGRYADASIVWILGGDRPPEEPEDYEITHAMARGIRSAAGGRHLITYHSSGMSSSSKFFHDADWLDFNLFQSGHSLLHNPNYTFVENDLSLSPAKPTLDGEPLYEYIHINFKTENPRFADFHSRRAGYWSVLAGALGHTYGHNSVWQMWSPEHHPVLGADVPWSEAIYYPGAHQAGYMRKAFESIDWQNLRPAQNLLLDPSDSVEQHIRVAATEKRDLILAYIPHGQSFTLGDASLPKIENAHWFNPRDGHSIPFALPEGGTFNPPGDESPANDWLLILSHN